MLTSSLSCQNKHFWGQTIKQYKTAEADQQKEIFTNFIFTIYDSHWCNKSLPEEGVHQKEQLMENHLQPSKMSHLLLI